MITDATETLRELDTTHNVRTLSGGEEAVSGWITINYLNGTLRRHYGQVSGLHPIAILFICCLEEKCQLTNTGCSRYGRGINADIVHPTQSISCTQ